ncbi:MAG TPA: VTT domain-containing protein [Candidatus Nanoarchaeia archaeon]|nr:VTT domain-containing protein [Candidatus Nanoarchaeia archaeon]
MVILVLILFGILIVAMKYIIIQKVPILGILINAIKKDLVNTTPIGLFYGHFIGGIFFVPSADELIFYYGLSKGSPPFLLLIFALTGYMLSQVVNYFLGEKIGPHLMHFISKKKVYKTRRFVNKYGAYGIIIFNILPFPAPLLTFALGIAKYNKYRLYFLMLITKTIEYLAIIAIFKLIPI